MREAYGTVSVARHIDSGSSCSHARTELDERLAAPMFWLSAVMLVLMAGALHLIPGLTIGSEAPGGEQAQTERAGSAASVDSLDPVVGRGCALAGAVCGWGVLLLYPVFWVESFVHRPAKDAGLRPRIGQLIFPPLRMGARDQATGGAIWLPRIGWASVDEALRGRVERGLSMPMLVIALLVLPLLAAEHYLEAAIHSDAWLMFVVKASSGLIWTAFTLEFVIMLSLAERRFRYVRQHWLDALIVCLPIVDFLPAARLGRLFRLGRIGRLQQLAKTSRVFRLRGTIMKVWRAILLLEVIDRVLGGTPDRRLKQLREQLVVREAEVARLRSEIAQLEARVPAADRDSRAA